MQSAPYTDYPLSGLAFALLGLNILPYVSFPVVLIVCGHGLYICLDLLVTLGERFATYSGPILHDGI